jgi:hypothetical protein
LIISSSIAWFVRLLIIILLFELEKLPLIELELELLLSLEGLKAAS